MNTSIMFLGTGVAFLLGVVAFLLGVVAGLGGGLLLLWGTWKLVQIALRLLNVIRAALFVLQLRSRGVSDDIITDKFLYRAPSDRGEE